MNAFKINNFAGRKNQSGATLVIIILSLLVLTVIGVAIFALTSTALLNQVAAQRAAQAFYLAESGIRIAASEYKAALLTSTTAADDTLANLHDKKFILPDNVSRFTLDIYPYWFRATSAYNAGVTSITLYLPGGVPLIDDTGDTAITFPTSGLLKIEDLRADRPFPWVGDTTTTTFASYTNVAVGTFNAASGGTPVTFTLSPAFPPAPNQIYAGDEFYIGNNSYTSTQDANPGGDLILALDSADTHDYTATIFPPHNGTIFVMNGPLSQYSYALRDTTTPHTVKLTNMQAIPLPAPTPQWPLTVPIGTPIYVGKSVGFRSASAYGP